MERLPLAKGKKFWGEGWWDVLHSGAAFYTPDHKDDYLRLVQGYKGSIPCQQCRGHFQQNLVKYPIDAYLSNNRSLLLWTYIIHDAVNQLHNEHHPEERKFSPPFTVIEKQYSGSPEVWIKSWKFVLQSSAVVYTPEHANNYVLLIEAFVGLIPSSTTKERFRQALKKCPVERYLRNNHDLFFWSYLVAGLAFPAKITIPYNDVKRYYFMGLGEECKTCDS